MKRQERQTHFGTTVRGARASVNRSDVGWFLGGYLALVLIWYVLGRAVVASDTIVEADTDAAQWFVDQRTADLNRLTAIGSSLSGTETKIVVTAVLAIAMRVVWKRWREPMVLILPLVLEAMVFITVTFLVGRSRPAVERLEGSPVNSSFPSGHAAAAMVYSAVLIVVFWHTRAWWMRILATAVTVAVAIAVAVSRVYRGMHHVSDVLAGLLLGGVSILFCWWLIDRAVSRNSVEAQNRASSVDDVAEYSGQAAYHG